MKKKAIIWILILAVIGGTVFLRIRLQNKSRFASVQTAKADVGDIKDYLSTTAAIKSKNSKDYYGLSGTVRSVNVKVGDSVKQGQDLVDYDVPDLNTPVIQAQLSYDNAVSQKDDLINTNNQNSAQLKSLGIESQIADVTNRLNDANNQINTIKNIKPVDNARLSEAEATRDQLQANLTQLKNTESQLRPISSEKMTQADNAIALAKANLDAAKKSSANQKSSLSADFDGVVTAVNVSAGAAGSPVQIAVTVQDLNNLEGVVLVSKYDVDKIKIGENAVFSTQDNQYNGRVSFIDPAAEQVQSSSGTETDLEVDLDILNKGNDIKVGFDSDVNILLGEVNNALKVPAESIKTDKDGTNYVFVIEGNKAVQRTVKLGLQSDTDAQILDGVKEGEEVILNPSTSISDGSLVKESVGVGK